ncbi:MAG: hypothetical protein IVW54_22275 [Candidatus Binataceae bacterium]|nr:hypothetical protein [Candidatus Binataceae bacterium]
MAVKNPSTWAGSWGSGVSGAGNMWATNYIAAGPAIFTKAAASVGNWQTAVASQAAADAFVSGLNGVNFAVVTASVNGAGKTKYTASGTTKQAKYNTFAGIFGPKLTSIVASLPPRGPRGSTQNRVRLTQLLDQVQATRGQN